MVAFMVMGRMGGMGLMGEIGLVATELRHTGNKEIGLMGLMGEVGRDGGGKNAAGVHGGSGLGIRGGR